MPKNTNNILLIGPMGSGKTSVAKLLANNLDKKFLDTDEEVMKKTGVDIAYIFDMEGEEGFRKRECLALKECLNDNNTVLSTGGGIVLSKLFASNLATEVFPEPMGPMSRILLVFFGINSKKR